MHRRNDDLQPAAKRGVAGTPPKPGAMLTRRGWLGVAGGAAIFTGLTGLIWFRRTDAGSKTTGTPLTMYAAAGCQCCHAWADHMEANGFRVTKTIMPDVSRTKDALGVPDGLRSCHTAEVAGYVVEGHVPAVILARFLAERPADRGLAAPGMPSGSPGMESTPKAPFDVIAFGADGSSRVYARA